MPNTTSVGIDSFIPASNVNVVRFPECTDGVVGLVLKETYGAWGGFSSSVSFATLPADSLSSEFTAFAISNGARFLYSLLYLLLIYNLSLISMEHEWGAWGDQKEEATVYNRFRQAV